MSEGLSNTDCKESDLYIFNGLEGFENFSTTDDSSIVALLDELQDETLMALLDDNMFTSGSPFGIFGQDCCDNVSLLVTEKCSGTQTLESHKKEISDRTKRSRSDSDTNEDSTLKRAKLSSITKQHRNSISSHDHTLACVMHDHCYASTYEDQHSLHQSGNNSDEEASNEEGSSSDTGYDTMSTSTSPGSRSSGSKRINCSSQLASPPGPNGSLPPICLPLRAGADPVALIDARIKHYMCSREVNLTEEEKEILKAEGLPIPTTLPLTKVEEKALKSVRRKIRNKVAAQESRKRKKELMQTLEERVSDYSRENFQLKKRVEVLENENKSLMEQLKKLQSVISNRSQDRRKVGRCIMVIILCFAVFFGGSTSNLWSAKKQAEYTTASVRSRSLLSVDPKFSFHTKACDWFKQIFMREKQLDYYDLLHESPPITNLHNTKYNLVARNITGCQSNQSIVPQ